MNTVNQNQTTKAKVSRRGSGRINDDWQYLNEGETVHNPSIDQKFNLEYKHKGLGSTSISKPKLVKKKTDQKTGVTTHTFRSTLKTTQIDHPSQEIEKKQVGRIKQAVTTVSNVKNQAFATVTNARLVIMFLPFYLIQLQLAIISAIGLATLTTVGTAANYVEKNWGLVGEVISSVVKAAAGLADSLLNYFIGVSLAEGAAGLFWIPFVIIFIFNIIFIFIVYINHKMAFNNPIFGKQGGYSKFVALIFYVFGLFPIFNIFPFFLIWLFTIQKYPK